MKSTKMTPMVQLDELLDICVDVSKSKLNVYFEVGDRAFDDEELLLSFVHAYICVKTDGYACPIVGLPLKCPSMAVKTARNLPEDRSTRRATESWLLVPTSASTRKAS